jgi:hypothetical protein
VPEVIHGTTRQAMLDEGRKKTLLLVLKKEMKTNPGLK